MFCIYLQGGDDNISWSEVFHAKWTDIYSGNGNSWEAVAPTEKPLVDTVEAEYVVRRLTELAPEALLGEKNFFLGWGLHKSDQFGGCLLCQANPASNLPQATSALPLP